MQRCQYKERCFCNYLVAQIGRENFGKFSTIEVKRTTMRNSLHVRIAVSDCVRIFHKN